MRIYFLILSFLISAEVMAQTPNYLYGKDVIVTTRDTSSADLTIKNSSRNVLGYFKNIGGGKGRYTLIPQIDVTGLPDSLLARYTKTQSDARYKPIGYFPSWAEITGIPANFTTTYLLSNDVKDSIQARVKITDTINMLRPYKKPVVVAWGNSLTAGTGATVADSNYVNNLARMMGWNVINKGVPGETSTQIKTRLLAESDDTLNMPTIICAGTNNYLDSATVVSDIAAMVAKLAHQRYLILSIPNRATEGIGSAGYNFAMKINTALMNIYGNHFVDWRTYLLGFSSGTTTDNTNVSVGIIPLSLRADAVHLNDKGYRLMAQKVAKSAEILTQGHDTYLNGLKIASDNGTPVFTNRGLEMYSILGKSYIQAYNRNPTVNSPDTLVLQFPANSILSLTPSVGSRIQVGQMPAYSSGGIRLLNWNSSGLLDHILPANLESSGGRLSVTNGSNAVLNNNVNIDLAASGVAANTYGDSLSVPRLTVDTYGRLTSVINKPILIGQGQVINLTTALAGKANLSGATFTGDILTAAGEGIIVGGGAYFVAPSATRGVLQVIGSTDQFVNMGTNGYLYGASNLLRINAVAGREFDVVADNTQAFKIFNTTRNARFQNGGTFVDSTAYRLQVIGSAWATTGVYAANGLFQASTANSSIELRGNGSGAANINQNNGGVFNFYGGGSSILWRGNTNGSVYNTANANSQFALATTNNGTTNAHGLLVELGASSTGLGQRITKGGSTIFEVSNNGALISASGVTAQRGRFTSLVVNKDSVPITTTNAWVLTTDTSGTPYTNRVNRRNINDFYVGDASFDTTARTLTLPKSGGGSTVVTIPRGTASGTSGITVLSSSRTGNLVTVSGDNGSSTIFSVRDADSSAPLSTLTASFGISGSPYNGGSNQTWLVDTSTISTKANVTGLLVGYATTADNALKLNIIDTAAMLSNRLRISDTLTMLANRLRISDTATMLSNRLRISDTLTMLDPYARKFNPLFSGTISGVDLSLTGDMVVAGAGSRTVRAYGGSIGSLRIAGDGSTYTTSLEFRNTDNGTINAGIFNYGISGVHQYLSIGGTAYNNSPLVVTPTNVGIGTATPTAKLDVDGNIKGKGFIQSISLKTSNYTLTENDHTVIFDVTAANRTATLPAGTEGQMFVIKMKGGDNTKVITVNPNGSETIESGASYSIFGSTCGDASYTFQFLSGNWYIISSHIPQCL